MSQALLLFDIDGTLIKTGGAGMRAMVLASQLTFGKQFKFDGIQVAGHLDPLIFAEAAEINGLEDSATDHKAFRDRYFQLLRMELAADPGRVLALRGVHEMLQRLRSRASRRQDVVLGLLSGNYRRAVPIKLTAVDIEPSWFPITAFGDEAETRSDLVLLAMKKYKAKYGQAINPEQVIVIGDTPRDVACAQAHGCVAFAVATGSFSCSDLEHVGANVVVEDLSDPAPLTRIIDQLTT